MRTAFLFPVGGQLHAQAPWTMLRLPDTRQTAKYTQTPGEDSFDSVNPPSFRKNADGTVIDNVTGLQWQQTDGGEKTRDASVSYCTGLALGEYQDWRLPYAQELFSILKHDALNPATDTAVFTKTTAEYWWSDDLQSDDGTFAWASNAGGGAAPYTDNPDGTVTDNRTGLIKELWSLNSVYVVRPLIHATFFPATASALFWSSTTQFNQAENAWTVDFTPGIASYNQKTQTLHVRLVRSGAGPRIRFCGIRNSASYGGGAISPGEVVAVFGSQMGFPEGKFGTVSGGVPASSVEGRSVLFGGVAAPVISWQDGQANVIVPGAVAGQGSVPVTVSVDGVTTPAQVVPVAPVEVRIGGLASELLYAGLVYGEPAGLLQLNVRVPGGVQTGDSVAAEVRVGAFGCQAGVMVAIR
jgi:hypothetical protein